MTKRAKMPGGTRAFLICTIAAILGAAYLLQPWADLVALITMFVIAGTSTLFALAYGFTVPWWETLIGRAMLSSSGGLALLVDISLLYKWLGDDYPLRDMVLLSVLFSIALGATFKLGALAVVKWQGWRSGRVRRMS